LDACVVDEHVDPVQGLEGRKDALPVRDVAVDLAATLAGLLARDQTKRHDVVANFAKGGGDRVTDLARTA
jgi:hypothetical protein